MSCLASFWFVAGTFLVTWFPGSTRREEENVINWVQRIFSALFSV
jgi:hypothetical protein